MKEESVYPKEDKVFDFCGAGYSGTFMMNTIHPCFSESDALSDVPEVRMLFYEKRRSLEKEDIFCNEDYRIDFSEDEATG